MKNKQAGFFVPLLLIVLVIGGGGTIYYLKSKTKSENVSKDLNYKTQEETTKEVGANSKEEYPNSKTSEKIFPDSGDMTLEQIFSTNKGKNLICKSFSTTPEGATISNTAYISSSNMRVDSLNTYKGTSSKGTVLIKGSTIYSWSGNEGFKVSLTGGFNLSTAFAMWQDYYSDSKSSYKCEPWTVDTSKFIVPSSVEFQDFGSQQIPSTSPQEIQKLMNAYIQ